MNSFRSKFTVLLKHLDYFSIYVQSTIILHKNIIRNFIIIAKINISKFILFIYTIFIVLTNSILFQYEKKSLGPIHHLICKNHWIIFKDKYSKIHRFREFDTSNANCTMQKKPSGPDPLPSSLTNCSLAPPRSFRVYDR